ncbi:hypothetical protein K439DRAFT_1664141 [Ramaria rubella]|nr:hypothetical protein K439DRAFT_1664141 [Ramaria rubella]
MQKGEVERERLNCGPRRGVLNLTLTVSAHGADFCYTLPLTHRTMSLASSSLAKKETAFASWGDAIRLIHGVLVPPYVENDLGTLLVFKPPRSLVELRDEEGIASSRINSFQRPIQQWASSNLSELQDGDTEEIARVWTNLSYAHHKIVKSTAQESKESSERQGIDDLLDCAFPPGNDTEHDVIFEAGLRLSRSAVFDKNTRTFMAPNADPATLVRPNAVADAIVTIRRKQFAAHIIGTLTNQSVADILVESQWASSYVNSPEVTSTIVFPAEYKRYSPTSSRHQLMMDLTTAQCQRKAIGLADAILYGATVDQGQFCIYASWWKMYKLKLLKEGRIAIVADERPTATPSNRGRTGNEPEAHEAGGSVQDKNMDEVPSLCEDEDENEDFTRQELNVWSEARDCYEHEAAVARAQLGGKPSSFDVIKVLFPEVEQPLSTVSPSMKGCTPLNPRLVFIFKILGL